MVDNVNVDLTEDIRRAIRAGATIFADRMGFPNIRIRPHLHNTISHDTGYVAYLGVSSIALAGVVAGGVLGGLVAAREWGIGKHAAPENLATGTDAGAPGSALSRGSDGTRQRR